MASSERLVALMEEPLEPGAMTGLPPLQATAAQQPTAGTSTTAATQSPAPTASATPTVATAAAQPDPSGTPGTGSPAARGDLVFQDVHFHYQEGEPVLQGIDLAVQAGSKVALVGFTGAGKTTLSKLLVRLYEPTAGRIFLDGEDIRSLEPRSLRRRIGVVLQDSFLFRGTVASNISLDDAGISRQQVEAAARTVQADGFIRSLPDGYDSLVAPRGSNFSTGQKQLLAFARALAFDPEVLILDEATSSVDPVTESRIQDALAQVTRGRTALIIAHRLSTIVAADRILVLDQGRLAEDGTHRDLLDRNGLYTRLYRLQAGREARRAGA
jgi:ATP-binding cassette subfamily B protein